MTITKHTVISATGEEIDISPIRRVEQDETAFTARLLEDDTTTAEYTALDGDWTFSYHKDGTVSFRLPESDLQDLFNHAAYGAWTSASSPYSRESEFTARRLRVLDDLYRRLERRLFDRRYYRFF